MVVGSIKLLYVECIIGTVTKSDMEKVAVKDIYVSGNKIVDPNKNEKAEAAVLACGQ